MGTEELFEAICLKLTELSDEGANYDAGIGRIRADNILYERLGMSGEEIIRVLASFRQKV